MDKKAISILSICQKAGKAITGEDMCIKAIVSGTAVLVIIAEDASENTKKKFTNKASYYNVPVIVWGTRDKLSGALGKYNRPTVVITDQSLSEKLKLILNSSGK